MFFGPKKDDPCAPRGAEKGVRSLSENMTDIPAGTSLGIGHIHNIRKEAIYRTEKRRRKAAAGY